MRGSHGCSAVTGITVAGCGAEGVNSRSEKINTLLTVARKRGTYTSVIVSTYCYNICRVIGSWVAGVTIVISAVVSCSGNETNPFGVSFVDRFLHRGRISSASP